MPQAEFNPSPVNDTSYEADAPSHLYLVIIIFMILVVFPLNSFQVNGNNYLCHAFFLCKNLRNP